MHLLKHLAVVAAVLISAFGIGPAQAGQFIDFGGTTWSTPPLVFVPSHPAEPLAPLIVIVHACEENADIVARVTRFNELAEANGVFLLYPNQETGRNPFNCFNWFLSDNEKPDSGEPAMIKAQIEKVKATYPIDPKHVYVVGWSAGGGTVPTLMACFPDEFAAGALHSGLPYGIATSIGPALDLMRNGPRPADEPRAENACNPAAFHGGVIIIQGTADQIVNPTNADRLLSDFLPPDTVKGPPGNFPPEGDKLGYEVFDWSAGGKLIVRELLVEGMDHAWSGGLPDMAYSDPRGPSATQMIWTFFTNFSRP